jgi:uncharacterized membrane protein
MTHFIAWIATAIAFLIADAIWLTQVGPRLYRPLIGEIMSDKLNVPPAAAFYLIYVSGIVFFAVAPALQSGGLGRAALNAAALGLVAYATYDLTNQATLKVWDIRVTLADMAWGAFASAMAAAAGYLIASRLR